MEETNVEDESQFWPVHLPQLKILDHHLRCPICRSHFDKPVIAVGCSHNFCSLCIRTYLTVKNSCPICHAEVSDRMLKPNRILDDILVSFHSVKKFVLCAVQNKGVTCDEATPAKLLRVDRLNISTPEKQTTSTPAHKRKIMFDEIPSTSKASAVVPCPICKMNVDEVKINTHLDSCLKNSKSSQQLTQKRKPLPKLIYSIMKEKELRKRLKDLHLNHLGDKSTLINRHRKYTSLFNAECDSPNPRPIEELIQQLEQEEAAEKKMGNKLLVPQAIQTHSAPRTKLDGAALEQSNLEYLRKHKDHFQKLIEEIRQRQNKIPQDKTENQNTSTDDEVIILPHIPKEIEEISLVDGDDLDEYESRDLPEGSSVVNQYIRPFSSVSDHSSDRISSFRQNRGS